MFSGRAVYCRSDPLEGCTLMIPESATTLELIIELNHYLSGVRSLVAMTAADINRCRTDRRGHQPRL